MKVDRSPPLVTLLLIAYNQEQFIREAVEGALTQTYSPLQIILSDDCSSDLTFDVIKEMASGYTGPHEVLLNRNERNLGLCAHINHLMSLAKGEFNVVAAGDDISAPARVSILVDTWLKGGKPSAVCSGFVSIDAHGHPLGDMPRWALELVSSVAASKEECLVGLITRRRPALIGCTEAWKRDIFGVFGPLDSGISYEDCALSLRAWLLDGIGCVTDRLVSYRSHSTNITYRAWVTDRSVRGFEDLERSSQERSERWGGVLAGFQRDIATAVRSGLVAEAMATRLQSEVARQKTISTVLANWWSVSATERLRWCVKWMLERDGRDRAMWGVCRLVPLRVFAAVCSAASRTRGAIRDLGTMAHKWKRADRSGSSR